MRGAEPAVQMLQHPGGRIAYEAGGDGPLLLCAPEMGQLRSSYRHAKPALTAAGFTVAAMDLRGHGDSEATFDRYDDVAAGEDMLALVGHLGGPAVLVGNSIAAGAAVWAAAERPDVVAGLALIAPFVRNAPMNPLLVAAFKAMMSGPWASRMPCCSRSPPPLSASASGARWTSGSPADTPNHSASSRNSASPASPPPPCTAPASTRSDLAWPPCLPSTTRWSTPAVSGCSSRRRGGRLEVHRHRYRRTLEGRPWLPPGSGSWPLDVIMPLTCGFVEPTPGFEPGTCRLQVVLVACQAVPRHVAEACLCRSAP